MRSGRLTRILACLTAFGSLVAGVAFGPYQGSAISPGVLDQVARNEIRSYLGVEAEARNWKFHEVELTRISTKQTDMEAETEWLVQGQFTLDFDSVDEVPVMRGMLQALSDIRAGGDAVRIALADAEVAQRAETLATYIRDKQEMTEIAKVTVQIDGSSLVVGSARLFLQDPVGGWKPWEDCVKSIPSSAEAEQSGRQALNLRVQKAEMKQRKAGILGPIPRDVYSHSRAVSYADTWVKTTTIICEDWPETCLQDQSNYNTAYKPHYCLDCANFVSQCLYYAGIPSDEEWYGSNHTDYNPWDYCPHLVSHMEARACFTLASESECVAGDLVFLIRGGEPSHAMMITYHDSQSMLYNAHTNDKRRAVLYVDTFEFYQVDCWIEQ